MINYLAIKAIYFHEMNRTRRTILQSIISPILSTSLYFIIFGSAIGSRIKEIDGVTYGMFIVPGLLMLNILTQSVSNGSFSTYFPKFNGTIYELQAAPISGIEMIIGFVGATATKSIILGTLIILTASFFIDLNVAHPFLMVFLLYIRTLVRVVELIVFLLLVLCAYLDEAFHLFSYDLLVLYNYPLLSLISI